MKKIFLLAAFAMFYSLGFSQSSPRATAEADNVSISYGQPSKKERKIFGELVPFNKVWRAGANEATEITFKEDMNFGGKPIKAGTYSLFINPTETEWTIILNPELKQWGSFNYDKIKEKDVLSVTVPAKPTGSIVEKLTYRFDDNNNLVIEWDDTMVEIPIN